MSNIPMTIVNTFVVCPITMRTQALNLAEVVTSKGTHPAKGLFEDNGAAQTPAQFYPNENISQDGSKFWFKGEFSFAEQKALDEIAGVELYTHTKFITEILPTNEWTAPEPLLPVAK